jgi:hypothetical protein
MVNMHLPYILYKILMYTVKNNNKISIFILFDIMAIISIPYVNKKCAKEKNKLKIIFIL